MKIFIKLDDKLTITSYGISLNENHIPFEDGIEVDTEIDLENLCMNYKYINGEFVELTDEEKEFYIPIPQLTLEEKVQLQEDKISILTQQMEQQDEINASLTYELMMLQEPVSIATLINNHSPKYNLIKSWFNKGYWNEEMLLNAVEKHYITEEEMNEIISNQ